MLAVGTWRLLATDTSGQHGTSLSVPFTALPCTPDETITPSPAPPRPGLPSTGGGADSMALLLGLGATVLGARALRGRR